MKHCTNCGERLDDKANFCNRCGAPAHENHYSYMPSEQEKTYKEKLLDAIKASNEEREWREDHPNNRFGLVTIILALLGAIALAVLLN